MRPANPAVCERDRSRRCFILLILDMDLLQVFLLYVASRSPLTLSIPFIIYVILPRLIIDWFLQKYHILTESKNWSVYHWVFRPGVLKGKLTL